MSELPFELSEACSVLLRLATGLAIVAFGVAVILRLTKHAEVTLMRQGNIAAAASLAATCVAMALPVSVSVLTAAGVHGILLWGCLSLGVQCAAYVVFLLWLPDTSAAIERGDIARALALAGLQISIAIVNAAAAV